MLNNNSDTTTASSDVASAQESMDNTASIAKTTEVVASTLESTDTASVTETVKVITPAQELTESHVVIETTEILMPTQESTDTASVTETVEIITPAQEPSESLAVIETAEEIVTPMQEFMETASVTEAVEVITPAQELTESHVVIETAEEIVTPTQESTDTASVTEAVEVITPAQEPTESHVVIETTEIVTPTPKSNRPTGTLSPSRSRPSDEKSALTQPSRKKDIEETEGYLTQLPKEKKLIQFNWSSQYEAICGISHINKSLKIPCQDTVISSHDARAMVILADGAGSAVVSEIGSQAVVLGVSRFLFTLENDLKNLLDSTEIIGNRTIQTFSLLIVKHAKGILEDLASLHKRSIDDFKCTLNVVVFGKVRTLWLKIGDGVIFFQKALENGLALETVGSLGKGEFANQTSFINSNLSPDSVEVGELNSNTIIGFGAMSDGAAEKLASNDGKRVAPQIGKWLDKLRSNELKRSELTQRFYSDEFVKGSTGDDCSIGLAACNFKLQ